MTGRQQENDHDGTPVLPTATLESGNTTESSAPRSTSRNNGTLSTGWDHSQGSTPHKAKPSQNSSVESLPQPKKPPKDAASTKKQQAPRHGNGKISIRDRIQHLTWAWFTTTMSTGGLALALGQTPHRFRGLEAIGTAVFILDLVLFLLLVAGIATRFALGPRGALKASLTDPTEAFFFPTFMLSISTIISNTQIYGQHHAASWLPAALRVVFWLYAALALLVAILLSLSLFTTPRVNTKCGPGTAAPNWVLPVFPAMLGWDG
ncbi:putative c4-dicarboxylate transporter malic acid transporter [Diplodia seriata]|uniref:Putative c4-dicarboxylate transporter malic acid transporter n=1 Tax=Diplodia seriata TaxID=420778 RepID=A0A0G2DRH6_9PEZI|nr:putative c4-dicarboxylate transporter malic acid transporter [Diplodia seriata]